MIYNYVFSNVYLEFLGAVRDGVHAPSPRGLRRLHIPEPRVNLARDLAALEPKVGLDDVGEARGRVAQVLEHRPANRGLANVGVVLLRGEEAAGRVAGLFVAGLVEVRVAHQDQALDRDEDLDFEENGEGVKRWRLNNSKKTVEYFLTSSQTHASLRIDHCQNLT